MTSCTAFLEEIYDFCSAIYMYTIYVGHTHASTHIYIYINKLQRFLCIVVKFSVCCIIFIIDIGRYNAWFMACKMLFKIIS